jgi:hypothetical protein
VEDPATCPTRLALPCYTMMVHNQNPQGAKPLICKSKGRTNRSSPRLHQLFGKTLNGILDQWLSISLWHTSMIHTQGANRVRPAPALP